MKKLGLSDVIFGKTSWREYDAINSAAEGVEALRTADVGLAQQISKLFRLDVEQSEEIERLRLTVKVLVEVLVNTVGPDAKILRYRLEAAADEAMAAAEQARARGAMVACDGCGDQIEKTRTNITTLGVVCDACLARA